MQKWWRFEMIELLYLYCVVCYFLALIANYQTKHMPWFMLIMAPFSAPITVAFIYCKALNKTFGDD